MIPRRIDAHDDLAGIVNVGDLIDSFFNYPSYSTSFKGKLVNTDDYDIIPKKSKIERDIKAKEEELARTEQRKENENQFYDSRIKSLQLEIDQLRQKLSP